MKIDLHCHTLKSKSGDSQTRNVTKDVFLKKVKAANVKVVGITNHNTFNYDQFVDFYNEDFDVWPGIELDICGEESVGHGIIVVNPEQVKDFNDAIAVLNIANVDEYKISCNNFAMLANKFDSIVILHYHKKPSLSDSDIAKIKECLNNIPLFLEPSDLISAGIFMAHNLNSIFGSDVQDWNDYEKLSFPELKTPVDSFRCFKLLINKDPNIIKSFVNKKDKEVFEITPFENSDDKINIELFDDVNIFIGGKGTGKTKILEAIEKHYRAKQNNNVSSYYAAAKTVKYQDMILSKLNNINFESLEIKDGTLQFNKLKEWKMPQVTSISSYFKWELSKNKSENFGFTSASFNDVVSSDDFENSLTRHTDILNSLKKLYKNLSSSFLEKDEYETLIRILDKVRIKSRELTIDKFAHLNALKLEEYSITKLKELYLLKKGKDSKPNGTGLLKIYESFTNLRNHSVELLTLMENSSKDFYEHIGDIPGKGSIFVKKVLTLNPDLSNFKVEGDSKLSDLRAVKTKIKEINKKIFSDEATASISELTKTLNENNITSLRDFLLFKVSTVKKVDNNYCDYDASNGEQAMLILDSVLCAEKDVFILDEPEMSVGHDYINSVIVPRINSLAKKNKVVVISTHDANIAVRTLPFKTYFRSDEKQGKTYVGSPFTDDMISMDSGEKVSWINTCIRKLEGGEIAFSERNIAYGRETL